MLDSSRESLERYLARIAERDQQVKAFVWHDADYVREQYDRLSANTKNLPLYGIPVAVKDIIDTVDMPTEYGSKAFAGNRPKADAGVVARLRTAGAIVMGKTVTTEFAHIHAGPTVNPHNFAHTPGGSSSGSCAAVADGMVPLAFGTQTGGSTIRPSAFCGIVGFKPTYGMIPLTGVNPFSTSLDTIGIHAKEVADAAVMYSVLRGQTMPPIQQSYDLRIGWFPGPYADRAGADAQQALKLARSTLLKRSGIDFVNLELPAQDFIDLTEGNNVIAAYEAAQSHRYVYARAADVMGEATRAIIEKGMSIPEAEYKAQLDHMTKCRVKFAQALEQVDAVLTFSATGQAPLLAQGTGDSVFNRAWTSLGTPCINLPLTKGDLGLPLGVQLVSAVGRDFRLLQIDQQIEKMFPRQSS